MPIQHEDCSLNDERLHSPSLLPIRPNPNEALPVRAPPRRPGNLARQPRSGDLKVSITGPGRTTGSFIAASAETTGIAASPPLGVDVDRCQLQRNDLVQGDVLRRQHPIQPIQRKRALFAEVVGNVRPDGIPPASPTLFR